MKTFIAVRCPLRMGERRRDKSSTMAKRRRYTKCISAIVGNHPRLFYPLYRLLEGSRPTCVVRGETVLTIEGYPRSGNTFAVQAFKIGQHRPLRIAHHLHVPAQVIHSVRCGIPTCVLIREPEDTIRSLLLKYPMLPPKVALLGYARFYETCYDYRQRFVTALFEQVICDFGAVIEQINTKFGTHFKRFEHTQGNLEKVHERLDHKARNAAGGEVFGGFSPNPMRETAKKKIELTRYAALQQRCTAIYHRFRAHAQEPEKQAPDPANEMTRLTPRSSMSSSTWHVLNGHTTYQRTQGRSHPKWPRMRNGDRPHCNA
jgi:hypothetical protein